MAFRVWLLSLSRMFKVHPHCSMDKPGLYSCSWPNNIPLCGCTTLAHPFISCWTLELLLPLGRLQCAAVSIRAQVLACAGVLLPRGPVPLPFFRTRCIKYQGLVGLCPRQWHRAQFPRAPARLPRPSALSPGLALSPLDAALCRWPRSGLSWSCGTRFCQEPRIFRAVWTDRPSRRRRYEWPGPGWGTRAWR